MSSVPVERWTSSARAANKKAPRSEVQTSPRASEMSGSLDDVTFMRLPEVKAVTGLSKTSIYELIRTRSFPAPVRLGPRAVAWLKSEIRNWAVERVQASRSAA
jgi:prophage regulatory protein